MARSIDMRTLRRATLVLLLAAGAAAGVLAIGPAAVAEPSPTSTAPAAATRPSDLPYRWFSLSIDVAGLPADAEFVPVACPIDFSALLAQLKVPGVVDEHSIGLVRLGQDGRETDEPVQFSPTPQPRLKQRAMLPDTPANVSYLGEYPAGVTPEGLKVAGALAWAARADRDGRARYRLEFGVLPVGTVVQVPFAPQNLRVFDQTGRATPVRWFPRMQVRPQMPMDGQVHLFDGRQLVTSYHLGPTVAEAVAGGNLPFRRPFFHPVNGPDGISLTEFGKPHDPTGSHAHHYSLWVAHASVEGKDFWGEKGGVIASEQLELAEDGPVFCRLVQRTRWLAGKDDLLHERRTMTLYATPGDFRLIDIELELSPSGKQDVTLGKTTFGFLAARVAQSMTVFDGGGEILNARGDRNERGAHLKHAEWIDQSGPVAQNAWAGVAMLDHPENANHPTVWHCRNDGWAGASFNADGPTTLKPGQPPLRLRYRVLLHGGDAVKGNVAGRYAEYVARPTIRLGEPAALDRHFP
jgi:hypothetical protein